MKTNYSQSFAISLKGHDAFQIYVVICEDDKFVYLSDGKHRKVSNPKKKKKKHIKCFYANKISEYISEETPITDGRLRRAIRSFKSDNEKLICEVSEILTPNAERRNYSG